MVLLCCQSESLWPKVHLHLSVLPKQQSFVLDHNAVLVSTYILLVLCLISLSMLICTHTCAPN